MNETTKEMAALAEEILEEGITVTIPRKNAIMLFGAVIAANVATVFVLQGIAIYAKRLVKKDDEDSSEE